MDMFERTLPLVGEEGIKKLRGAHVAVFGLGGVGSYAAEALARAGVGCLTVVDDDVISPSNLNRQLYALHSTLGMAKVRRGKKPYSGHQPPCHGQRPQNAFRQRSGDGLFL